MKQKLLVFFVLLLVIALLAGLNAATYVQKEKVPDTEFAPNRSTYNSGSTGTQALFALLSETGRKVTRWQRPLETIATDKDRPAMLVIVGPLRREISDDESTKLMEWVAGGGTLVLIDREPPGSLATTTAPWQISVSPEVSTEQFTVDASDQKQMTADTPAMKAIQPSTFSQRVNAVQPSRFASSIKIERYADTREQTSGSTFKAKAPAPKLASATPKPTAPPKPFELRPTEEPTPVTAVGADDEDGTGEGTGLGVITADDGRPSFQAPLVHLGDSKRNILVEAPFSRGRVIVLSDPYIVANNGIGSVDNAQLAINLLNAGDRTVAFDEYHHGYGANNNRLFQYFEGTPVIAIFLQCGLLVALILLSQSPRFARPIPEPEQNRLSKLEYVSAMAELQQRTRAYDLAIENIYADFRRRVSALVGLDNTTASRADVARRIADRIGGDAKEIEHLLFQCEDIVHGEPVGQRETVALIEKIRAIEDKLGLHRSPRKGL